jgi:hypothetical protein
MNRCAGCTVGAEHAGEKVVAVSPVQAHKICCRCFRSSSRLIRGVICVSCFNRELELVKGKNAKGLPPVKHPPVGAFGFRVRVSGGQARDRRFERVTGASEAMFATIHKHGTGVQFGFAGGFRVTWVQEALF